MSRYPTDQFCEPPLDSFLCSICQDVFDDPMETPCRHVFCRECILPAVREGAGCPLCSTSASQDNLQPVLPLFKSALSELKMWCKFEWCEAEIPLEKYLSHIENCDFKLVGCPFESCISTCCSKDLNKHMEKCEFRKIVCPKDCGETIVYKDCEQHIENECMNRDRKCPHCKKLDHAANDYQDCIQHLLTLMDDIKLDNDKLEEEMQCLRQNYVSLYEEAELLRHRDEILEEEVQLLRHRDKMLEEQVQALRQQNANQQLELNTLRHQLGLINNRMIIPHPGFHQVSFNRMSYPPPALMNPMVHTNSIIIPQLNKIPQLTATTTAKCEASLNAALLTATTLSAAAPQSSATTTTKCQASLSTEPVITTTLSVESSQSTATATTKCEAPPSPEPLKVTTLSEASPQQKRQMVGEKLFPIIKEDHPDCAGKITGMLLEMDSSQQLRLLEDTDFRKKKVEEALAVLHAHQTREKSLNNTKYKAPVSSEPLTADMLSAAVAPSKQKQMLGERLFPLIQEDHPDLAGMITGILLERDDSILLSLIDDEELRKKKVKEALEVLTVHQAKGLTPISN